MIWEHFLNQKVYIWLKNYKVVYGYLREVGDKFIVVEKFKGGTKVINIELIESIEPFIDAKKMR
jgi:hypothetical protein